MAIKVDLDGRTYRVHQRDGFVLIYLQENKPFGRSTLYWDSRKGKLTLDSAASKVLAKASRRSTITLTKGA